MKVDSPSVLVVMDSSKTIIRVNIQNNLIYIIDCVFLELQVVRHLSTLITVTDKFS